MFKAQNANVKTQIYNAKLKTDLRSRSYAFSVHLIKFINGLPNQKVYWTIGDQLLRAGTSIGANVIEAKAASSKRDFIKFYDISLKSANETKYWFCLLRDATDADNNIIEILLKESTELSNMLAASLLTLKNKR